MNPGSEQLTSLSGMVKVILGISVLLLLFAMLISSRESQREAAGIRAEAQVKAFTDAFKEDIHELKASNRNLQIKVQYHQKAIWQGSFPEIDQATLDKLQEIINAQD